MDDYPTPDQPRPGTALLAASHTIEFEATNLDDLADFLERVTFILRARRRVRITIE